MARPPREVDKPTYVVEGKIERFDMRDTPTARFMLEPGTPQYEDYYSRHPEKKEWDDKNRQLVADARKHGKKENPINQQLRPAVYWARNILGEPSIVKAGTLANVEGDSQAAAISGGRVDRVEIDPVAMTKKLKAFGEYLGAGKIRIGKLKQEWVYTHKAEQAGPGAYGKPVKLDYENIITVAYPHRNNIKMLKDGIKTANNIESGWTYARLGLVCVTLAHFIQSLGWRARALPPCPEGEMVMAVPNAVDAGIGEQGRTCHCVTKEFGNAIRLGEIVTDMPLVIDKPVDFGLQDFCEKCHICADYCPSGMIRHEKREVVRGVRRWVVDGNKCRRYRASIGHNCSICLVVCPWAHPNNLFHDTIREIAEYLPWTRRFLIQCERIFYSKGKNGKYKQVPEPEWITSKATKS